MTLVLALPLSASTITSALTGRITSGGNPVAGATVRLTSSALQHPRVSRTGSYGTYWLTALPPGVYEVTFSAKGMQTITRRATIELARVARTDAVLEPSEDEETVTSTAKTVRVGDTTSITTHFSDWLLDRLPYGRHPHQAATLSPGINYYSVVLDGTAGIHQSMHLGEESVERLTMIRGAAPIEQELSGGTTLVLQSRSGSNELSLTLRDALTSLNRVAGPYASDVRHSFDATAGGRLARDRLWFFAGGWAADEATVPIDEHGALVKLTSQLGPSHNLIGTWLRSERTLDVNYGQGDVEDGVVALHHIGAISPRLTIESTASRVRHRTSERSTGHSEERNALFGRITYVLPASRGDHVLSAGVSTADTDGAGMLFVNDRWSYGRWIVEGGVRQQRISGYQETNPRAVVVYDVRGDGRRAIQASFTRYGPPSEDPLTEYTAGWIAALGSSGAFRIDAIRSTTRHRARLRVDADASYRLFDRLEVGGTASYFLREEISTTLPIRQANAWLSVDVPLGSHAASFTVLQRYQGGAGYGDDAGASETSLAARYRMPVSKVNLTLAADVINVFNNSPDTRLLPRALRVWARFRL